MRLGKLVRATALTGILASILVSAPVGAVPIVVDQSNVNATPPGTGQNPQTVTVLPLSMRFSAEPLGAKIGRKTVALVDAIGVTGGGAGEEIDDEQSITVDRFSLPVSLASFTLAFLFDGPEFDDVQEVAQVEVSLLGGGSLIGTLTTKYSDTAPYTATWSLPVPGGTTVIASNPPTGSGAAVWTVDNPFGNVLITSATFTAIRGVGCAPCDGVAGGSTCTNPSDFGIARLQFAVPEPGMLALLGSGLIGLGAVLRRRREA